MEVWLRGISDQMHKGAKTFLEPRVWFWYRLLVNYCPLVFNFCLNARDSSSSEQNDHDRRCRPTFLRCCSAPDMCIAPLNHCSFTKALSHISSHLTMVPLPLLQGTSWSYLRIDKVMIQMSSIKKRNADSDDVAHVLTITWARIFPKASHVLSEEWWVNDLFWKHIFITCCIWMTSHCKS